MLAPATPNFDTTTAKRPARKSKTDFKFVPLAMFEKFKSFVEAYHRSRGFGTLPELLWTGEARDFIEMNRLLLKAYKRASMIRGAKKANAYYVTIATVILATEALASDFAGWGRHFPSARLKALAIYAEFPSHRRTHLLDIYLSPRGSMPSDALMRISPT
jgi:hypothetical protein